MEHMTAIRKSLGLSVEELAEKSGISKNMIWSYESDRREPPLDVLCTIADAMDCSLDLLVRGKEKDRLKGRSKVELMEMFDEMTEDELTLLSMLIQASLADKRLRSRLSQANQ